MTLDAHSNLVESTVQLSKDISSFGHRFSEPSQFELQAELQQHIDKVSSQKKRLSMLLESSESISRIVSKKDLISTSKILSFLTFLPYFYLSSSRYSTTATTKLFTRTSSL